MENDENPYSKRTRIEIPENNIGIYIFGHAELLPTDIIRSPPGIDITKSNLGGYGCLSYPTNLERRPSTPEAVARSLRTDMSSAITCNEYQTYTHGSLNYSKGKRYDSHGYEIDKKDSCQIFENNNQWVLKEYSPTTIIMFAYQDTTCDLMQIPYHEFVHIFGFREFTHGSNSYKILMKIKELFKLRTQKGMSTKVIFYILYLFQKKYSVETVRIIDESCNAVIDKRERVHYQKLDDTYVTEYRAVSRETIPPLAPDIGYGGKKKSKKYKIRRKNKSKKIY